MKKYLLTEVESVRGDGILLRCLRAIRDALNDVSGRSTSGRATLENGAVVVKVTGLQEATVIVPGYARMLGTTGTLSCSPDEYDVQGKTATIRSTSATDGSDVAWVAVT